MKAKGYKFNDIVEAIYNLPLEDKLELKNLLENYIAESRRNEIASNYKQAQQEQKAQKLKFSSSIEDLKSL